MMKWRMVFRLSPDRESCTACMKHGSVHWHFQQFCLASPGNKYPTNPEGENQLEKRDYKIGVCHENACLLETSWSSHDCVRCVCLELLDLLFNREAAKEVRHSHVRHIRAEPLELVADLHSGTKPVGAGSAQ